MHTRDFFADHKIKAPPAKIENQFEHFKQELKEWAKIDLDALMFHVASLEEKTVDSLKASLPEIL